MIKNDIALLIEEKSELNRVKSLLMVDTILASLREALANEEKVEIRGFASFKIVCSPARVKRARACPMLSSP